MVSAIDKTNECPICGAQVTHINNHVRLSNGHGHGAMGGYPDNWDMKSKVVSEPVEQTAEPDEPPTSDLQLTDHKADRRIYNCECGQTLKYHAEQCPKCDEPKQWRGIV